MQVKTAGHSQAFLFLACLAASAKLILFLQTLYVYCVYAAMSKSKKKKKQQQKTAKFYWKPKLD